MAMRTGCCLNLSPPPCSLRNSNSSLPAQVSVSLCAKNERSGKRQSVLWVGVACSVVGLELLMSHSGNGYVNAKDEPWVRTEYVSNSEGGVSRWSDGGACLPWRQNSLETVVPEKLPRPTARRRWETVGFSKDALPPPPPTTTTITILHAKSSANCFVM